VEKTTVHNNLRLAAAGAVGGSSAAGLLSGAENALSAPLAAKRCGLDHCCDRSVR
jgi:hypothetical protein